MNRQDRKNDRGTTDAERCFEIGQRVLRKLEQLDQEGVGRPQVQVYGDPGNEYVEAPNTT